jgi:hypothetical protein
MNDGSPHPREPPTHALGAHRDQFDHTWVTGFTAPIIRHPGIPVVPSDCPATSRRSSWSKRSRDFDSNSGLRAGMAFVAHRPKAARPALDAKRQRASCIQRTQRGVLACAISVLNQKTKRRILAPRDAEKVTIPSSCRREQEELVCDIMQARVQIVKGELFHCCFFHIGF